MPKINRSIEKTSLHYPDDLGVGFTYPDCIKIEIVKKDGLSLDGVKKTLNSTIQEGKITRFTQINNSIIDLNKQLAEADKADQEKIESINASIKTQTTELNELSRRLGTDDITLSDTGALLTNPIKVLKDSLAAVRAENKKLSEEHIQSIYLPMPEQLGYNEAVDWSGADLGIAKAGMDALLADPKQSDIKGAALGQAGNILAGGAGSLVGSLLGSGVLGGAIGAVALGGDAQAAIESKFRVKSNPFKEQTFQGVGFRPFQFDFKFNARSQSEVVTIKEIINAFRRYSKPSLESPESSIFKYPAEFKIKFLTNNGADSLITNKWLPKIKNCICKSVNTNFTSAGWHSFEDGAPTTISLQLGFEEVDIVTNESVEEGF
jgi:hypothetical protein